MKLRDLCLHITDGEHGSVQGDQEGGYFFLNNNNITDSGIRIKVNDKRISEQIFRAIRSRTKLEKGDMVIATYGTLGKTAVLEEKPDAYEFSRSVGMIKPDRTKLLPHYLHYYLMLPASQKRIDRISSGGVQKHFYISDMEDFEIDAPSLDEQYAITLLLCNLDKKIQNNKKLMHELEETARLIYDYWFTQFDFPDENGNPYRSSGGKMVWNDQLKREIPEDWEVGTLAEILTLKKDTCLPQSGSLYEHYSIPSFDLNKMPEFSDGSTIDSRKYVIHTGDLLYSKLNPKFKRLWRPARIESLNAICSTEFLVLHPVDNHFSAFCYSVLDSNHFYGYMVTNAISSTGSRSRVSPDVAMNYMLPIAPSKVEQFYSDITQPFMEKIDAMTLENSWLASLRDWLLPMLINGQVVIDE